MKPIRSALIIFFCWLATILPARALALSVSPNSIVLSDQLQLVKLHPYAYFVDTSRQLTAADIAQRFIRGEFKGPNHKAMTFGYTDSHYWVAFSIRNDSSEEAWYLLPGHPLLETQVYRIQADRTPVRQASLEERYAVTEMKVPPQTEAQFLALVTSRVALSLQFELMTRTELSRRLQQEAMFLSAVLGCFLAMLFYNLFLYLTLRDKNYLFYLLFALVNVHFDLLTVNFPSGIWNWMGYSWWDIIGYYRPLAPLTAFIFARSFLRIQDHSPRLDRWIFAYIIGLFLLILVHRMVPHAQLMSATDLYFLVGVFFLLYLGVHSLIQGFTPARYYLAGIGTFLVGVAICLMQMMGWLPAHPLTINAIVAAQAIEMILMSLALGGRYKLIQEERLKAEFSSGVKSHLLRTISHDIANPLAIVKGYSFKLQKENPDSKAVTGIVRAVGMIEDIMRFVQKTEYMKQGMHIDLTVVSLQEVFASLAFLFEGKAQEKKLNLEFHLEHPGLTVKAEKTSLTTEILGNFLSNAIKFSPPGKTVRMEARVHSKEYIMISIEDQGAGISPEQLETLFDPRHNLSRPGTDGEQGVGYGMPLAKAFLDAFGATVEVTSKTVQADSVASGTVFRILIHAAPPLQSM
ncbi:MAG TPA: sensor histidine kinase [Oligoflexus sp.]|uniref:sensor histidine kinase n=1 Tax=Oligoflexus sp. TaxID=1971216 RepID=UPI002D7F1F0C|nr:sensor histidine kinase [Oligoflexus sp.]HET9237072.1 sensor histidine kinase [Oligoflexus sp.]